MPREARIPDFTATDKHYAMVEQIRAAVVERVGPQATFEARQLAARAVAHEVLWLDEETQLQALVTDAPTIEVEGKTYGRLEQASSSTLHGLLGTHIVNEKLYREVGVRNGPTLKPIELRVGVVTRAMLPDLGRVAGMLHGYMPSREVERVLVEMGFAPPSRAFLDGHLRKMGGELADQVERLEQAAREVEAKQDEPSVASISCGLDRMAVRMDEPLSPARAATKVELAEHRAKKVYNRRPPPPAEYNWRMMWVGSMTTYDDEGRALQTRRYAIDASEESDSLVRRVLADVKAAVERYPGCPVVRVQDGAKDLAPLPRALHHDLAGRDLGGLADDLLDIAVNDGVYERTDFHHLLGYLDGVVATCEPTGDPHEKKKWYRQELLSADDAIDRIYRNLRRRRAQLPDHAKTPGAVALDGAISYIKDRRSSMCYATLRQHGLTIGSGATESTCALMQLRTKRPGMAWEIPGLRGVLAVRALVLSERWPAAWAAYRTAARRQVLAA